jgi:hypothetical protein
MAIDEIDFFLAPKFLISVSHGHVGRASYFARLEEAIQRDLVNVYRGPDFLLHVIMDYIVDEKFKAIEALQEELDTAEETVIETPTNFQPAGLLRLRRSLLTLRKRDPCPDMPPGFTLHLRGGDLSLSGHLRPPDQVLRGHRDLPGDDHQPHGDIPVCPQ